MLNNKQLIFALVLTINNQYLPYKKYIFFDHFKQLQKPVKARGRCRCTSHTNNVSYLCAGHVQYLIRHPPQCPSIKSSTQLIRVHIARVQSIFIFKSWGLNLGPSPRARVLFLLGRLASLVAI
ncbi:Hypothetical_protein [Hexamita inflata]|uniref:Hypothetical_protein n=1 Tax=Hexamita inflata TaxID=28002 RepID=A0AA86UW31_9EUKA|nr:Hypothetical protein HINF_LOCUS61755 [Hexamita inflata]